MRLKRQARPSEIHPQSMPYILLGDHNLTWGVSYLRDSMQDGKKAASGAGTFLVPAPQGWVMVDRRRESS